jgi:hypothetical protein
LRTAFLIAMVGLAEKAEYARAQLWAHVEADRLRSLRGD